MEHRPISQPSTISQFTLVSTIAFGGDERDFSMHVRFVI